MSVMTVKRAGAIIGGSAVVGAAALCIGVSSHGSEVVTAKSTVKSSTTPPSTPTVSMAVPSIKGPAPLYPGLFPGQNPGD